MFFQWEQEVNRKKRKHTWVLKHKETGSIVLRLYLSEHADYYDDIRFRSRILRAYECYFIQVWSKAFRFFS